MTALTLGDIQRLVLDRGTHVLSIRAGKRGGWVVNVRENENVWVKPIDKEWPTIEAAVRAYYDLPDAPTVDLDLEDLIG